MEPKQIASFVVRFQLAAVEKETGKKQWRIKVTHVQEERETLFDTIEEATAFMMSMVEDT
ncbi:hypothetical protein QNH48_24705 [Neobacillus sp. YX16]|jgi:hypothetical protein|uniref:hypothetical protein n=1 Tax=Neobacillus sp. YX16 TaxID=3047874 RepID=UPI00105A2A59|nr:hypothetical protein [Neobacillus sp. YX16]TDL74055.1 hypothetical protein E2R56_14385 [Rhodococcus qingshengii]WHZ02118.1 hypothetical protein QNH48_24705 [Neobacillus sp. YX16]